MSVDKIELTEDQLEDLELIVAIYNEKAIKGDRLDEQILTLQKREQTVLE